MADYGYGPPDEEVARLKAEVARSEAENKRLEAEVIRLEARPSPTPCSLPVLILSAIVSFLVIFFAVWAALEAYGPKPNLPSPAPSPPPTTPAPSPTTQPAIPEYCDDKRKAFQNSSSYPNAKMSPFAVMSFAEVRGVEQYLFASGVAASPAHMAKYFAHNQLLCDADAFTKKEIFGNSNWGDTCVGQYTCTAENLKEAVQKKNTTHEKMCNPYANDYIHSIEILPPLKDEAVAWLDKKGPYPGRYAQAQIVSGKTKEAIVYKVGPIESIKCKSGREKVCKTMEGSTTCERGMDRKCKTMDEDYEAYDVSQLTHDPTWRGVFNDRQIDGYDWDMLGKYVLKDVFDKLAPMLDEEWGKDIKYNEQHSGRLRIHVSAPPGIAVDNRIHQVRTKVMVAGSSRGDDLTPLPLSLWVTANGNDVTTWKVAKLWYLKQGPYDSVDALLSDWNNNNNFKTWKLPPALRLLNQSTKWVYANSRRGSPAKSDDHKWGMDLTDKPGPTMYMPKGPRFTYETDTGYVEWLGWRFSPGCSFNRGPFGFDIKFRGERIIYEAALQDVAVVYSADDPVTANVMFLDAQYGMGAVPNVIDGVDCPPDATYLPFSYYKEGGHGVTPGVKTIHRAFCVFEWDTGTPLWRRRDLDQWAGGQRETKLLMRTAFTVGNYDYVITMAFSLDGGFQVFSDTTGYLQSYWFDENDALHQVKPAGTDFRGKKVGTRGSITGDDSEPQGEDPFANRVEDYTMAALHDHSVSIKLDIDLDGVENALRVTKFKAGTPKDFMNNVDEPTYILYHPMRYAERHLVRTENDSLSDQSTMDPQYWEFINQKSRTKGNIAKFPKAKFPNGNANCKGNKWCHPRGYRLTLMTDHKQVLPDTHPFMGGCPMDPTTREQLNADCQNSKRGVGQFTRRNLFVTQRKENEQHSTGRFDANRIGDPEVSVVDFIEGYDGGLSPATAAETAAKPVNTKDRMPTKGKLSESIVDKDLVAWVSFGMIHLPIVEDKPMTNMVHMGLTFKPANWGDENEALEHPVDIFVNHNAVPDGKQPYHDKNGKLFLEPARTADWCEPTAIQQKNYTCGWGSEVYSEKYWNCHKQTPRVD